jgi:hypothetical protein
MKKICQFVYQVLDREGFSKLFLQEGIDNGFAAAFGSFALRYIQPHYNWPVGPIPKFILMSSQWLHIFYFIASNDNIGLYRCKTEKDALLQNVASVVLEPYYCC